MTQSRFLKRALTAGACAAIGTAAGIAGSAAAPSSARPTIGPVAGPPPGLPAGAFQVKLGVGGGAPVHGTEIVPNRSGTGFDTLTHDSGTVTAVAGDHLTISEGTGKATYATPTLTIPGNAAVVRDFKRATLADIHTGDHVDVSSSSDGTANVLAFDAQNWPPKPPRGVGFGVTAKGGPPGPGVVFGFSSSAP
jgi:hypothetical protein